MSSAIHRLYEMSICLVSSMSVGVLAQGGMLAWRAYRPRLHLRKKILSPPSSLCLCIDVFWLRYASEYVYSSVNTTKQKWYYI